MRLGYDIVVALGEAAGKYEGTYTEDFQGATIRLVSKSGPYIENHLPSIYFPKDVLLKDRYIANEIRKAIILLDDKVLHFNKFAISARK